MSSAPRWWPVLRWTTLAASLATVAAVLTLGSHPSDYDALRAGLSDGSVTAVHIDGAIGGPDGIDPTASGTATVQLSWHGRRVDHHAEVLQLVGDPSTNDQGDHRLPRITGRVDTPLREISPSVQLTWGEHRSTEFFVAGWTVPGWVLLGLLATFMGLVATLALGPEPRWATRWGWWWLMFSGLGIVTIPAYLLFGVRPGTGRRLNGWWAFLVALFAPSLVG